MNQRDLELLSAYLDGQLKPSDSALLKSRLSSDPNLRAVLDDLRTARGLLRQLPPRRAPRNFTLTRKMVGQNPPMPRAYPLFRFATALATLLFFFTVGLNFMAPQLASQAPAFGMGGGGEPETFAAQEAPAATEAPALEATEPPAEPSADLAPLPTLMPTLEDTARTAETPTAKNGEAGNSVTQEQAPAPNTAPLVSYTWQILLAMIAATGALLMIVMRWLAISRWR